MSVLFPALPGGAQRKVSFSCSVFGLHARVTVVPKRQADAAAPAGPAAAGKVACDKGQASPYRRRSTPGILPLPLPAKGNHPDDTPVLGSSLVRTTHALPPMLPRALASQPCQAVSKRKAQQLSSSSSKDLVLFHSVLPRVSRVQRCGCPIQQHASGPTSLLSVREPRSACRNDFKHIAKRGTTVCEFQRLRLCWSHVCLAVTTAETHARLHACKLVRLPKEERGKRLLYKKLYSSGFRARAPSPKREMVMLG